VREALGLEELAEVSIIQVRVHGGDDASCLNLNRAQSPQVLGVPPAFRDRDAFTFAGRSARAARRGWDVLIADDPTAVPAIADQNTIMWALRTQINAELPGVDGRGNPAAFHLDAAVSRSVLQGSLLIAEERFVELYPDESGYRLFFIDAPAAQSAAVREELSQALVDYGVEVKPAEAVLAELNAVEHAYLSIFHVLGGLGLVLGCVGLAAIVCRNVLERRGELALLRAVGFTRGQLRRLVLVEHAGLLLLGLVSGVVAAVVAVLPALSAPGADVPVAGLLLVLVAVLANGLLWIAGATAATLRGPLQSALCAGCCGRGSWALPCYEGAATARDRWSRQPSVIRIRRDMTDSTPPARARILSAAFELFHRQGVNATAIDEILAASDTGKGQFYHYFGSKDALVHAVVQDFYDKLRHRELPMPYDIDSLDDLERWFSFFIGFQQQAGCSRGCPMATIGYELAPDQELVRQDIHLTFEYTRNLLESLFHRLQARGELAADATPAALADFCYAIMQGGMLTAKIKKDTTPFENAVAQAMFYLRDLAIGA
jgi:AcrR family transcriptional regulator